MASARCNRCCSLFLFLFPNPRLCPLLPPATAPSCPPPVHRSEEKPSHHMSRSCMAPAPMTR
jgi:hypothetical protein